MKKTAGLVVSLCALLMMAFATNAGAETLTISVPLTPGAEITPPVPVPAAATGNAVITIRITRDAAGNITAATMNFRGTFKFPTPVSVVGFHIHEGAVTANGPIRFDLGINTGSAIYFSTGEGFIDLNAYTVDLSVLPRLLATPSNFYVNAHTTDNPAGAVRGQIVKLVETSANSVALTTAEEISTVPLPPNASGGGTFTVSPVRDTKGVITGGSVTFTATADLPANSTVTGLHIHRADKGVNGPIVIDSGVSGARPVPLPTGKGTINSTVPLTTAAQIQTLKDLLANPTGFYMNLHTSVNPGGVIRGQLTAVTEAPGIVISDTQFIQTGSADVPVNLWCSGVDSSSGVLVNGQQTIAYLNTVNAIYNVTISGAARTAPGLLYLQVRNKNGVLSRPYIIVVGTQLNATALTTVDAAKFGSLVSPDAIAAGFGSGLASQVVAATTSPLPTSLDGTSVYVNGLAAPIFYVSPTQINYLLPFSTPIVPGSSVLVLARDGTVSRGTLSMATSIPSIFTSNSMGTGAPAAVASVDGQNFNIKVGNADGTANPIDANNYVALFGTGVRYGAPASIKVTIGGVDVTPLFAGPQGQLEGSDQINIQIPASLAGKGDVDLVLFVDNRGSNQTKLKIR